MNRLVQDSILARPLTLLSLDVPGRIGSEAPLRRIEIFQLVGLRTPGVETFDGLSLPLTGALDQVLQVTVPRARSMEVCCDFHGIRSVLLDQGVTNSKEGDLIFLYTRLVHLNPGLDIEGFELRALLFTCHQYIMSRMVIRDKSDRPGLGTVYAWPSRSRRSSNRPARISNTPAT